MNIEIDTDKKDAEYPDDHHTLVYDPITTWIRDDVVYKSDLPGDVIFHHDELPSQARKQTNQSQMAMRRLDALHYWFDESDVGVEGYDVEDDPTGQIAIHIARKLRRSDLHILANKDLPDWKVIRDNTTFINGPGFGDLNHLVSVLKADLGNNCVHIDVNDIHSHVDKSIHSVLFSLLNVERKANLIIEDRICECFNTREALKYLNAAPEEKITLPAPAGADPSSAVTERKWFLESRWLTDHLIRNFPKFRTNFDTLIITGAAARINSDDINVNRLYRLMARLGRVNTRIVFVG